jgi:hypothetical protein
MEGAICSALDDDAQGSPATPPPPPPPAAREKFKFAGQRTISAHERDPETLLGYPFGSGRSAASTQPVGTRWGVAHFRRVVLMEGLTL